MTDKAAIIALWKLCFPEDTDVFIDLYFNNLYKNEDVLIAVADNRPVAFLQMLPCVLETEEKNYPTGYIYGVMTHPGYRHKGYMNQLLTTALSTLKERDYDYAFLIPQSPELAHTYAKYGFQLPVTSYQLPVTGYQLPVGRIVPSGAQLDVAKQDFSDEYSKTPGMLLRLNDTVPAILNWNAYAMLD